HCDPSLPRRSPSPAGDRCVLQWATRRAPDRRAGSGRLVVRGLPPRAAVRFPGDHPRDRDDLRRRPANRDHHVQPDARDPRRPEASLHLPLDRLPRSGHRDRHRPPQGPRHRRGAGGLVGLCHGASAFDEPVQATRCRRDAGLGRVAPSPRSRVAHPRADRPHSRSGPQVQGRHRGRQGGGRRRTGRMTTTLGDLTSFARELRDAGLGVTPDQIAHMGQALTLVDPAHEPSVRAAFRSLTITDPGQIETFETVFDAFFHRVAEEDAPVYSPGYTQPKAVKPLFAPAEPAPVGDVDTRTGSSATERLAARDFADMDEDQLAEARRLVTTMFWRPPVTRTRRWIPDGGGQRPDMRRTLRRSVGPGGDLLPIEMRRRRVRQRPLIIIADISGSMERYAE